MSHVQPLMIAIMGPTASGKTALAERLADRYDAQLFAADAFHVYRGMDIGTAKPEAKSRYRLVDIRDPSEKITVGEWIGLAADELTKLFAVHKNAIFVGGTGLYMRALFEDYARLMPPPSAEIREEIRLREESGGLTALVQWLQETNSEVAEQIDLKNPVRVRRALERVLSPQSENLFPLPPYKRVKIALVPNKAQLSLRIHHRVREMVQNGWVSEVQTLAQKGVNELDPGMRAIGYRTLLDFCKGNLTKEQAIEAIAIETRQYAKRQRTWLRKEPNLQVIEEFGESDRTFDEACRLIELI